MCLKLYVIFQIYESSLYHIFEETLKLKLNEDSVYSCQY